jgi:hypothetical protein
MVPLILAVLAGTSGYAGLLAWRSDDGASTTGATTNLLSLGFARISTAWLAIAGSAKRILQR